MRAVTSTSLPMKWRYLRDGVGTLLGAIGIERATALARLVARVIFSVGPPAREGIESNLQEVYAGSSTDCELRARQVFENVASFWVELLYCHRRVTRTGWRRCVHVRAMDDWQDVARQRRPMLLVTGYLGNPAVAACVLSDIMSPVHVLVDPASRMLIDSARGVAGRFPGLRLIDVHESARLVPEVMRAGGRLLMLADPRSSERGGVVGTFLGRRARRHATIARLAHRHDAEIVVFACPRVGSVPFRFELSMIDRIRPDDRPATASEITQRHLSALERAVREWPAQYLWTRR